ncbi:MAG: DUF2279 domain-containing protein [Vicingaceae bacterium]
MAETPNRFFFILFLILGLQCAQFAKAQKVSTLDTIREFDPIKFKTVVMGGGLFYAGTLTGLSTIWYKDYENVGFHLFNDNNGWMQIDKFGHAYTSYIMGKGGYRSLLWAGVDRKKAIWYGGSYGFIFLTSVEIIDAHYAQWGFSVGDMLSNAFGSALLISQELLAGSQVITMKFSYHPTNLAQYRPELLGSGGIERIIKDYNGQTYWFSLNYRSLFKGHHAVPKWLSISGGYAAYGMLGGDDNPANFPTTQRYRRYFLSLDINFERIKTRSKMLNSMFFFLDLIKFPLPAIEFNEKGEVVFHPIYF